MFNFKTNRKVFSVELFMCLMSRDFPKDFPKRLQLGLQSQRQFTAQSKYLDKKPGWFAWRMRKLIKSIYDCA